MLTHGGVFPDEELKGRVGVARLRSDEHGFKDTVGAEANIGDNPSRLIESFHGLSHLLRRRVRFRLIVWWRLGRVVEDLGLL